MSDDNATRQNDCDRTVTVELEPADARLLLGILSGEKNRARQAADPCERRGAVRYATLEEAVYLALTEQGRPTNGNEPLAANEVAIDRRHLIDLAGLAEYALADHLEDHAIDAAYEAAGVEPDGSA